MSRTDVYVDVVVDADNLGTNRGAFRLERIKYLAEESVRGCKLRRIILLRSKQLHHRAAYVCFDQTPDGVALVRITDIVCAPKHIDYGSYLMGVLSERIYGASKIAEGLGVGAQAAMDIAVSTSSSLVRRAMRAVVDREEPAPEMALLCISDRDKPLSTTAAKSIGYANVLTVPCGELLAAGRSSSDDSATSPDDYSDSEI